MNCDHRARCGLHCRVVRRGSGVGAEEVILGWSEHDVVTAAREPLSYPEHALWVSDDAAELAYACRNGADLPWWQ